MEYREYIDSDKIKIWPVHNRALQYGYTGYINSEVNIGEISNSVLHKNSFVIEGCELSKVSSNIHITEGKVLAGGYLIELTEAIDIPLTSFAEGDGIYNLLISLAVSPTIITYENTLYDVATTFDMQELDIEDTFIWIEKDSESFDTTNAPLLGKIEKQGNNYTVITSKASTSKFDASKLKLNWTAPTAGQPGISFGSQSNTLQEQFENLAITDSFGDNTDITENLILTYNDDSTLIINLKQLTNNSSTITLTKSLIPKIEKLVSISIPTCVTNIQPGIFPNTIPLTSISVPFIGTSRTGTSDPTSVMLSTLWENRNVSSTLTTFTLFPGPTTITSDAFHLNPSDNLSVPIGLPLVTIKLPESITTLNNNCFLNLDHLRNINIPSNVTVIPERCFENTDLRAVDIPDNITIIRSRAFENCVNLRDLDISDSVTTIDAAAFKDCTRLQNIKLPNTLTYIPVSMFENCQGFNTVTLPGTLTGIGDYAFKGTYTRILTLPSTLTYIGTECFAESQISNMYLPASITTLGTGIFKNCSRIMNIEYYASVDTLPVSMFEGCVNIARVILATSTGTGNKVIIGSTLRKIDSYAFKDCTSMLYIEIPTSVEEIGEGILSGCESLGSISLPFTGATKQLSTTLYPFGYLFGTQVQDTTKFTATQQSVSIMSQYYSSANYTSESTYQGTWSTETYYIPNNMRIIEYTGTVIPVRAFEGCTTVRTFYSDSLILICDGAFGGATNLNYFQGLTTLDSTTIALIGWGAFYGCAFQYSIFLPATLGTTLTTGISWIDGNGSNELYGEGIRSDAFGNCTRLTSFDGSAAIHSGFLVSDVFYGCSSLRSCIFSTNITGLNLMNFRGCTSLTSITLSITTQVANITGENIWYPTGVTFVVPNSLLSNYRSTYPNYTFTGM